MTTRHKASFDVELIPAGIERFQRRDWQSYDGTLASLGSKDSPWYSQEVNIQVHADGLATEFAPLAPCPDAAAFLATYSRLKTFTEHMIGRQLVGADWVDIGRCKAFTERNAPYLYVLAHTLGCSQDYDLEGARTVPSVVKQSSIKEIGFHVHLDLHPKFCDDADAVRSIVEEFYAATNFLHSEWTAERPPWYRAPMTYRPKPYGVEYRSIGAGIVEDAGRLGLLASIAFDFMDDHFTTHSKEYHV